MYDASVLANNVLKRSFDEGYDITPMHLQKILFFIAAQYIKAAETPLLAERFQAWDYGPVLQSIYHEFKPFGASPIRRYSKDSEGNAYILDESSAPLVKQIIDEVWDSIKGRPAFQLSRITHNAGSAWYQAWQATRPYLDDEAMRSDETYFSDLGLSFPGE